MNCLRSSPFLPVASLLQRPFLLLGFQCRFIAQALAHELFALFADFPVASLVTLCHLFLLRELLLSAANAVAGRIRLEASNRAAIRISGSFHFGEKIQHRRYRPYCQA